MSVALPWRIGCVPYLNARPLIYGIEDQITLSPPSRLADLMYRGRFDAGLVPIAEVIQHDRYDVLDGIAIATRGRIQSVYLVHREPIEKLKRVAVDTASRTSAWLVRIILQYGYNVAPEFYPRPEGGKLSEHEAMMLIGDEALWYRTRNGSQPILDLGEAWVELTGLPFVFAAWALQRGVDGKAIGGPLHAAKMQGLANIERIVQDATEATPEIRREYLTKNLSYELGAAEKQGIRRFQQYLKEMRLVDGCHDLRYVS